MTRRGLTLPEVLVAMGVAVVVGALLLSIMLNSAGLFYKQSSTLEEGLNINDSLAKIRQSIKEAQSIDAASTDVNLVLKIPATASSGNIISDTFDYIIFFQDQTKLRYKLLPDAISSRKSQDQIFSTSVDSLTFKYLDWQNPPNEVSPASATRVRIILSLRQKTGQNIEVNTATSEASLRND